MTDPGPLWQTVHSDQAGQGSASPSRMLVTATLHRLQPG